MPAFEENSFEDRTGIPARPEVYSYPRGAEMILGGATMRKWWRFFVCYFRGHLSYPTYYKGKILVEQCQRCYIVR